MVLGYVNAGVYTLDSECKRLGGTQQREPLSVTIAVNDAVAGPAGGANEKTPVVGLIVAPAAAAGRRLARRSGRGK